jgi:hypothetical protein
MTEPEPVLTDDDRQPNDIDFPPIDLHRQSITLPTEYDVSQTVLNLEKFPFSERDPRSQAIGGAYVSDHHGQDPYIVLYMLSSDDILSIISVILSITLNHLITLLS